MIIIILTVIIEGAKTPAEQRGTIRNSLFIESGVFQAVGVISFGKFTTISVGSITNLLIAFVCRKLYRYSI